MWLVVPAPAGHSNDAAPATFLAMRAPEHISSARLTLRRPVHTDAQAIYQAYAGDASVTRMLAWPCHTSIDDTVAFIDWSDSEWATRSVGPYVILDQSGAVIGSTGLDVEAPHRAATGYVLARQAWGHGYATEATHTMAVLADELGISRLYALCHPENRASTNVLRKTGFMREGLLRRHTVFPNLHPAAPHDVECWARLSGESWSQPG